MNTLVQIPGSPIWVNPRYVTSVSPARPWADGIPRCVVEYEGNAGYRTRTVETTAPIADVVAALNRQED